MMMQFLEAILTTTGSMYLLTVNGKKILMEYGLYQGKRAESNERNLNSPFDPATEAVPCFCPIPSRKVRPQAEVIVPIKGRK